MTAKREETGTAYLRVGTTIYKRVQQPLSSGRSIETLLAWNVETLRQDFGKDYLARIPKYDGFCTIPDHTNYRREIHGFLNRYEPISSVPAEGEFPHIRDFLVHIFGEQARTGVRLPATALPAAPAATADLLLVSSERNTGKTTFLNFLKQIFGGNVTFNTNEDFRSQFNDDWAGKLLICVDEVLLNRREDSERIKNLSTVRSYKAEAKGRDRREVEFFGKFVLCSNNERNPVLIEAGETRYWVRRIPPLTHDDQHLLAQMQTEIPGLLFFLQRRTLSTREESRLWFSPRLLATEALRRIIHYNRSKPEAEMLSIIRDILDGEKLEEYQFDVSDMVNMLEIRGIRVDHPTVRRTLTESWQLWPAPPTYYQRYTITYNGEINGRRARRHGSTPSRGSGSANCLTTSPACRMWMRRIHSVFLFLTLSYKSSLQNLTTARTYGATCRVRTM